MGTGASGPRRRWSIVKQKWSDDDLTVVRGLLPPGCLPWHNVDAVSVYFTWLCFV